MLRQRLRELAIERVRWGYRRLHILLEREGVRVNHKRVYRLYREEGLAVRRRKRKRVAVARQPMATPTRLNECWAMDFMSDSLASGRRYRVLNVVDALSRESLASEVDTSLPALRVIRTLEEIAVLRGYPARITVDNGPEFRSVQLDAWAYEHGVVLEFIQPGKPIQNPFVESYNGKMRDELLNLHCCGASRRLATLFRSFERTSTRCVHIARSTIRRRRSSRGVMLQPSTRRDWHRDLRQLWGKVTNVDIVPVSRYVPNDTIVHYNVPDMVHGRWLVARPRRHNTAVAGMSEAKRELIRMIKTWNLAHSGLLQSYHIEVLTLHMPEITGTWPFEVRYFFEKAYTLLAAPLAHPDSDAGIVDSYLDQATREDVRSRVVRAWQRASDAETAANLGDYVKAMRISKIIFGDDFPSHG